MLSYTVTERDGCRIVTGQVPLSAFGSLTKGMPKSAVMDTDLARTLDAMFVIGAPADIEKLKAAPDVIALARAQAAAVGGDLSPAAQNWLACGERGLSSEAMFYRFTGVGKAGKDHPCDPADFRRCRLLLEQVPEFAEMLPLMSEVSRVWEALVACWDELCNMMDAEVPDWRTGKSGRAPETYQRMQALGCSF